MVDLALILLQKLVQRVQLVDIAFRVVLQLRFVVNALCYAPDLLLPKLIGDGLLSAV
ncbi:hypothetical protein CGSHi22121_05245 [Haemophilus influenzae 22.1-21]|nr:hypothetical protein CGSHi22121_05245 [Haemophilus influenzae 22.1-21]